jgi:hypothetical protein
MTDRSRMTEQDHDHIPTDWHALAMEEQAKKNTGPAAERAAEIESEKQEVRDEAAARDLELKEEARRAPGRIS